MTEPVEPDPDTGASNAGESDRPTVSLVISVWNRQQDLRENLAAIRQQTRAPEQVIVVDNDSTDGTPEMVVAEFPEVDLIKMPNSAYGAGETVNIGCASAWGDYVGILDDDVILPTDFVEKMLEEFDAEPASTVLLSPKVIEPEMPEEYLASEALNRPRYMSTFRGCGSMAKSKELREAEYYDERFFIFGNERDLTTRFLNLGYRVKMVPSIEVFHKAPFGMRHGKRSLYYHVRNFWLWAFKYVPWSQVVSYPFAFLRKGLGGKKSDGEATDAVGTIGLFDNIKSVPGGYWICVKATLAAVWNLPYCLKRRQVCRAQDFELPLRKCPAGLGGSRRERVTIHAMDALSRPPRSAGRNRKSTFPGAGFRIPGQCKIASVVSRVTQGSEREPSGLRLPRAPD